MSKEESETWDLDWNKRMTAWLLKLSPTFFFYNTVIVDFILNQHLIRSGVRVRTFKTARKTVGSPHWKENELLAAPTEYLGIMF